ncbi:MAG: hypothetical protein H6605_05670 [Flavobacteriales bacterium]|nr:hypothetical protein [Flavobacteriales bacterium]
MEEEELQVLSGLDKLDNKQQILEALLVQLEKDTGLDYTKVVANAKDPEFLANLNSDLEHYLKKVSGQSNTNFMHLIYRTDISQKKLSTIGPEEDYFGALSKMILNRMLQKVITRTYYKSDKKD